MLAACVHGQPGESCENPRCREIWRLYQQAVQEERREENDWVCAHNARKRRGKTKSQYEIALENARVSKSEDCEIKAADNRDESQLESVGNRKRFPNLFPDEITLRAAVQFRAVTPRQEQLLKAYLESDEGLPNYKRWDAIGQKIGCSGKTVEREFRTLVKKFLRTKNKNAGSGSEVGIEALHIRGERRPRYYRKHSIQFGEWRRDWSEPITDEKVIRELRRQRSPIVRSHGIRSLSSPVNQLFGELIAEFAGDLPERERVPPKGMSVSDWEYNMRRARRILAGKNHCSGPWTAAEVYRKLGRGSRLCAACGTFLIRGFRINGRRITRAKQFCDDACKMRSQRWQKRMATGNLPKSRSLRESKEVLSR
jgi:hypothetical protein